jgi:RHS repeat-associated protein
MRTNSSPRFVPARFCLALAFALAQFLVAPARAAETSPVLADFDGDTYQVILTGPGSFDLTQVDQGGVLGSIDALTVTGTTIKSTLRVVVKRGAEGDGRVAIRSIGGTTPLKSILAGASDLTGSGIHLPGAVARITVANIAPGATITSGATTPGANRRLPHLTLTAGQIGAGFALNAAGQTLFLNAARVLGATIAARNVGTFKVTAGGFAGTLQAERRILSIRLTGGDLTGTITAPAIGPVQVLKNAAQAGGNVVDSLIAALKIGAITIAGNLTNSKILGGAQLGDDAALGGRGDAADTFGAGSVGSVRIRGSVTASILGAGYSPFDGIFANGNDGIHGGNRSRLGRFTVTGTIDAVSRIGSGIFGPVTVNGTRINPKIDARFLTRRLKNEFIPPDPAVVAKTVDRTVAANVADSTAFLYTGRNPIQTGVVPGTIKPVRAGVLWGFVRNKGGGVLPGVSITVLGHPEFGETHSRADGTFDMAVNGGGVVSVKFEKDGFIPAQRQINAASQDFSMARDVMLLPLDERVTPVQFGSATTQVHEASMQVDADGRRHAMLIFHPGTTAMLHQPDGTTAPLALGSVRVTEFTVGPDGPAAMPAVLPPNSAYTYCAALSVDEAENPGAAQVDFSQPVHLYVENFLNFPVGIPVPNGYLNRATGLWQAEKSGVVVKILSITGGAANLDVDGDAAADTGAKLTALGVTDAERQQLTGKYAAGQSLWRIPLMHFSTVDANWPGSRSGPAGGPNGGPPFTPPPPDKDDDPPGFFVQSQRSFERIGIAGTPFTLNYHSNRVSGYKAGNRVRVPLSGASLTGAVQRIDLEVSVAGRVFTQEFAPAANLSTDFIWDGRDAYGRDAVGAQPATVKVSYAYPGVYSSTRTFGANGEFVLAGNPTREETTTSTTHKVTLGNFDIRRQSIGGWTLDVHHVYDPTERRLYLGDGSVRSVGSVSNGVSTAVGSGGAFTAGFQNDGIKAADARLLRPAFAAVAADGTLYFTDANLHQIFRVDPDGTQRVIAGTALSGGYNGDERPARDALLSAPFGIAVAPDGTVYFNDGGNRRTRSITPDGIIHTVAGDGVDGYSGDGGPARSARTGLCVNLSRAADGSLFISDSNKHAIRRVSTTGIITTVAGNGTRGFSGDGGLATAAQLGFPLGTALDREGNLYIVDGENRRIRRVGTDGIITTIAGDGTGAANPTDAAGDGGPAIAAKIGHQQPGFGLDPNGLRVDPQGNVLFSDAGLHRIRKITRDGTITSIAGSGLTPGSLTAPNGDDGAALQARFGGPTDVEVAPDGSIYIADETLLRIRRIVPTLPGFNGTDIAIASEDGSQLFRFDQSGRHLSTVNTLTGATLFTFGYEADGQLAKITDGNGNATKIQRTGGGAPVAIVGPYGHRTTLATDAAGSLSNLRSPSGSAYTFTSNSGGLLLSETDPTGQTHVFAYDAAGRLTQADSAGPATINLARVEVPGGYFVNTTSALGVRQKFQVETLPTGDELRTNTDAANLVTTRRLGAAATDVTTTPDGLIEAATLGGDPRFSLQAPLETLRTVATPGGPLLTVEVSRTVTLNNPANPLSLATIHETWRVNGQTYSGAYDAATRTATGTSPAGRVSRAKLNAIGNTVQTKFADFEPLDFTYDARGRTTRVSTGSGAETRTVQRTYNAVGEVATFTDPFGLVYRSRYDADGRRTALTLPDGGVVQAGYDAANRVTSVAPPGRPAHLFTFAANGGLASYTAPAIAGAAEKWQLVYDTDDRVSRLTRPDGTLVSIGYDSAGRPATRSVGGQTTTAAYDPATGYPSTITQPGGNALTMSYRGPYPTGLAWTGTIAGSVSHSIDNDLRMTSQSVNGANPIAFSYDPDGLLISAGALTLTRAAASGVVTSAQIGNVLKNLAYNGFGEQTSLTVTAGGAPVLSQQYTRDKLGRIVRRVESVSGGAANTWSFTYDAVRRLSEVNVNGTVQNTFTYDRNGNRLTDGPASVATDVRDRLTQYGAETFTHTPNGELRTRTVGGQTTTYSYDAFGNLVGAALPGGEAVEYLVDGRGRRIGRKLNGTLTRGYLYQNQHRVVAELDGANTVISRFVYGDRLQVPDYMVKGGVTYCFVLDMTGSVRLVVDAATGVIAQRLDYDAFGRVLADTNPGFQPFGFAGGLYDAATGLVHFGARDYAPALGRWLTKDSRLFTGETTNFYSYVENDPVNRIDPTGHEAVVIVRMEGGEYGMHDFYGIGDPDTGNLQFFDFIPVDGLPGGFDSWKNVPGQFVDRGNTLPPFRIPQPPQKTKLVYQREITDAQAREILRNLRKAARKPANQQPFFNYITANCRARPAQIINEVLNRGWDRGINCNIDYSYF